VLRVALQVAFALNMHQKDVDVRVKRVGGGFGGKATRFFMYSAAALAAKLLNRCPQFPSAHDTTRHDTTRHDDTTHRSPSHVRVRVRRPVKHTLDRGTDSQAAGTRAPYHFKYKVGATSAGKIIAVDFQVSRSPLFRFRFRFRFHFETLF
jgi:xanthine dehydrogenase molybdopterin-binding subunit B